MENTLLKIGLTASMKVLALSFLVNLQILFGFLMIADCNPIASRRILAVLERGEIKQVTVTAGLFFDEIGDSLADIGVQMKIIPPYHYPTKNHIEDNAKIDYAVMDHLKGEASTYVKNLTSTQLKEVERRIIEAENSISKIPYVFERK